MRTLQALCVLDLATLDSPNSVWRSCVTGASVFVFQLKDSLQDLPQSLSQLVQYSLERLCSQYRGLLGLRRALAVLAVSTTGMSQYHVSST